MRRLICCTAIYGGFLGSIMLTPLLAQAALTGPSDVGIQFVANGPAGINIVGESGELRLRDDGQSITLVAPLAPLHTGIGLRDRHMKEKYLEVSKYPDAVFRLERKAVALPGAGSKLARDARGELKLHGQSKPIAVHYVATKDATGYEVSASFQIDMTQFGISVPSYLGVTVKPDVQVSVQFHVQGS